MITPACTAYTRPKSHGHRATPTPSTSVDMRTRALIPIRSYSAARTSQLLRFPPKDSRAAYGAGVKSLLPSFSVECSVHFTEMFVGDMRVDLRRRDIGVPEERLH